ncbi:amino acid adenylation domain-containing protein [Streptomyces sp. V2I9]|nr:amino acid adenylation domain-containing protein [Streptomyces sp. V2I9]MDQ0987942.1 amino acid adenylation domain-containing protein [Streptomyces sp. V2I9]
MKPAHERFAARAAAQPGSLAVVQGPVRLTYAELEERAHRIVGRLRARRVGRGDVVMAHLSRSPDLVAIMLATWMTGAAYLPVEPGTPGERLATLARRSGCALVVTASAGGRLPYLDLPLLGLDEPASPDEPPAGDPAPPCPPVSGTDLAYVIYTSGSTGAPKGVEVEHSSLAYLLAHINERYDIAPGDRVLQLAAITFDTSLEQILVTLANGATLVLPDRMWAPGELVEEIHRHQVTAMDLSPAFWRAFLADLEGRPQELPVRLTIVGGSAVHLSDCESHLRLLPGSRLVNAYGLTETAVTSCTAEIIAELTSGPLAEHGSAPVGHPLPGTGVHLLTEALQPVPAGQEGEIYLSGPALARGYVDAEATAARFVPGTGQTAGLRLYRTGDLGILAPEGLRVTGRADRQLKIRGYRVEPAEIEKALTAHPEVTDAAVKPYTRYGDLALAVYYATGTTEPPGSGTCAVTSAHACPPTWCPRRSCRSSACRSRPTGRSTSRRSPRSARPPDGSHREAPASLASSSSNSASGFRTTSCTRRRNWAASDSMNSRLYSAVRKQIAPRKPRSAETIENDRSDLTTTSSVPMASTSRPELHVSASAGMFSYVNIVSNRAVGRPSRREPRCARSCARG